MGKLVDGQWLTDEQLLAAEAKQYDGAKGRFQRGTAKFRNWITASGEPDPSGEGGFAAEAGRYHLYAAINCPWAHRTLIYRVIKQLEPLIIVCRSLLRCETIRVGSSIARKNALLMRSTMLPSYMSSTFGQIRHLRDE